MGTAAGQGPEQDALRHRSPMPGARPSPRAGRIPRESSRPSPPPAEAGSRCAKHAACSISRTSPRAWALPAETLHSPLGNAGPGTRVALQALRGTAAASDPPRCLPRGPWLPGTRSCLNPAGTARGEQPLHVPAVTWGWQQEEKGASHCAGAAGQPRLPPSLGGGGKGNE